MQWYEPEVEAIFVDADRIYRTLRGALDAPGLPIVAQAGFEATHDGEPLDDHAFNWLCEDDFLQPSPSLQNRIERYRNMAGSKGDLRATMQRDLRRVQQLRAKVKEIDRELNAGSRLFKSKANTWKVRSQRDAAEKEIGQLTVNASRTESQIDKSTALLHGILDEIHRDPELQSARWYGQRIIKVTFFGEFLCEYLEDMNPDHFTGRSVAEIIEIGHSLA